MHEVGDALILNSALMHDGEHTHDTTQHVAASRARAPRTHTHNNDNETSSTLCVGAALIRDPGASCL